MKCGKISVNTDLRQNPIPLNILQLRAENPDIGVNKASIIVGDGNGNVLNQEHITEAFGFINIGESGDNRRIYEICETDTDSINDDTIVEEYKEIIGRITRGKNAGKKTGAQHWGNDR